MSRLTGEGCIILTDMALVPAISLGCEHHPGQGCRTRYCSHILPLDLTAAPKDIHTILGLFTAIRRSPTHDHQQIQHLSSAGTGWSDDCSTALECRFGADAYNFAVRL